MSEQQRAADVRENAPKGEQTAPANVAESAAISEATTEMLGTPGDANNDYSNYFNTARKQGVASQPMAELPPLEIGDDESDINSPEAAPPAGDPRDSVFLMTTQYPGRPRPVELTAFPVALDGGTGDATDGRRTFATAAHGVADYQSQRLFGPVDFVFTDANGDNQLSREELDQQAREFLSRPTKERVQTANDMAHLSARFTEVSGISRDIDPNAQGITEAGIAEYYRQNTQVTIHTPQGDMPATLLGEDRDNDVVIMQVQGLTPETEHAIGPNLPIAEDDAQRGDEFVALGWRDGVLRQDEGEVRKPHPTQWAEEAVLNTADIIQGMSGGPLISRETGEVIGLNHTSGYYGATHVPASTIRNVLHDAAEALQ